MPNLIHRPANPSGCPDSSSSAHSLSESFGESFEAEDGARKRSAGVTRGVTEGIADGAVLSGSRPQIGEQSVDFAIRVPATAEALPCGLCGALLKAAGPTGYLHQRVVCDSCLLAGDRGLGMAMLMLTVCRFYGSARPGEGAEESELRKELLAFARLYDRFCGPFGEARPWSGFLATHR